MTQLVTVQTDFRDIEQMAHGLTGRVQTTYVILPTGDAVDEGEWAQFEIALFDGTVGLAGLGRCVTLVDNGGRFVKFRGTVTGNVMEGTAQAPGGTEVRWSAKRSG